MFNRKCEKLAINAREKLSQAFVGKTISVKLSDKMLNFIKIFQHFHRLEKRISFKIRVTDAEIMDEKIGLYDVVIAPDIYSVQCLTIKHQEYDQPLYM